MLTLIAYITSFLDLTTKTTEIGDHNGDRRTQRRHANTTETGEHNGDWRTNANADEHMRKLTI